MSQIFPPAANSAARLSILAALLGVAVLVIVISFVPHTSYSTGVGLTVRQPIQFSHKHHVQGLGLDCRFCHTSVERSNTAGYPDVWTCMGCHSQEWSKAAMLAPVRESFNRGRSLKWRRVHNLPGHVYFDHSIHIQKGIGCVSCHGRVSEMASVVQVRPFTMKDCNSCHQAPAAQVRPQNEITNENWTRDAGTSPEEMATLQSVHPLKIQDCTLCHR